MFWKGTFMLRRLRPWHLNISKRQVKAPKIYLRDSGLLHALLEIESQANLERNPILGASWEGFALEQTLSLIQAKDVYFWGTHAGGEIDLVFFQGGRPFGIEFKFNETPRSTRSMFNAMHDLELEHLWVVAPAKHSYLLRDNMSVMPLEELDRLPDEIQRLVSRRSSG